MYLVCNYISLIANSDLHQKEQYTNLQHCPTGKINGHLVSLINEHCWQGTIMEKCITLFPVVDHYQMLPDAHLNCQCHI